VAAGDPQSRHRGHADGMAAREGAVRRGTLRSHAIVADLARELREARLDRGLSQGVVGGAAGLSPSQVSRIERGRAPSVTFEQACRLLAVVGLELSARAYPAGPPLRDAAHVALLGRLHARLHASLGWRTEVPLGIPGDPRAWDAVIRGRSWRIGVEAETRPRDAQALLRRLSLKARDDRIDRVLLVLAATRSNRTFVRAASDVLGTRLAADGSRTLELLGAGVCPEGDALVLI
jgi:transcriptional regulator with XRE-family HTH domain